MYAIPVSDAQQSSLVATTPCGLEIAGDGDVNHATLPGVVVGETTDNSFFFTLEPSTECVIVVCLKGRCVPLYSSRPACPRYIFNVAFSCGNDCHGTTGEGDANLAFAYEASDAGVAVCVCVCGALTRGLLFPATPLILPPLVRLRDQAWHPQQSTSS